MALISAPAAPPASLLFPFPHPEAARAKTDPMTSNTFLVGLRIALPWFEQSVICPDIVLAQGAAVKKRARADGAAGRSLLLFGGSLIGPKILHLDLGSLRNARRLRRGRRRRSLRRASHPASRAS